MICLAKDSLDKIKISETNAEDNINEAQLKADEIIEQAKLEAQDILSSSLKSAKAKANIKIGIAKSQSIKKSKEIVKSEEDNFEKIEEIFKVNKKQIIQEIIKKVI